MQKETYLKDIINNYSDMVYKVALTRCGNVENAEDVFQNVFMKLSEKMPKFKSEEHKKAWLIRVTINFSKNMNMSAWNRKVVTLDENMEFETKEESDVFSVVCDLPQNYRTVIYLYYYEGYKVEEIAKLMSSTSGTIKTWLYRAREILKTKLEGGFENE
ncbi:MAG: sigma-70 family RNA polymerase sigma factor [Clostridia bacterium]|nr:sigma-70 family RNA polymerase sigma factor [Clostridia bacterium]